MKKLFIIITLLASISCENMTQRTSKSAIPSVINYKSSTINLPTYSPWTVIKDTGQINIPYNQRIDTELQKLLISKRSFQQLATQSEPYMYYIIDQLKKKRMPIELAIVPLMESAYNPQAISSAEAAGLWQIIPTTAKAYGMVSNRWYDSRRDLIASTDAALDYLKYLNNLFGGDWLLTLAAYNAGEGRVKRAQLWNRQHQLPTHFWALNLPSQTMQYIPKLLAIINIIQNHKKYDFDLPEGNRENKLVQFNIGENIKLETIAQLTDLTMNELQAYNAGYINKRLNRSHHLLIPKNQAKKLYDQLIKNNFSNVKVIDLSVMAKQQNDSQFCEVHKTNNTYMAITNHDLKYYLKEHNRHRQVIYKIKRGDNLSTIAKYHKTSINQLVKLNKIQNVNHLKIGDRLIINIRS